MATTATRASARRPQGPGMIDDQRERQQHQPAEQQRARRDHHRVIFGQPQSEDRGAGKGNGGEQDRDLGDDLVTEAAERIEADDDGGAGKAKDGADELEQRRRLMPGDAPGDQEGEDRRGRGQHHRARCGDVKLRPGDHQKRDRRIDGLLLGEQLPGLCVGRQAHAARMQHRDEEERPRPASAPR